MGSSFGLRKPIAVHARVMRHMPVSGIDFDVGCERLRPRSRFYRRQAA
jgi:hypothetical protein